MHTLLEGNTLATLYIVELGHTSFTPKTHNNIAQQYQDGRTSIGASCPWLYSLSIYTIVKGLLRFKALLCTTTVLPTC